MHFYKKGGRLSAHFHPNLCECIAAEWLIFMQNKFSIPLKNIVGILMVTIIICCMLSISISNPVLPISTCNIYYEANTSDTQITIYPQNPIYEDTSVTYQDFILKINGAYFQKHWTWKAGPDWKAVPPQIYFADLNLDSENEIIFLFSNEASSGTSVHSENIYVVDLTGIDYPVENPQQYLEENLQIHLSKTDTNVLVDVDIKGKQQQLKYRPEVFPDLNTLNSIGLLDWTEYEIENNLLFVKIPFATYSTFVVGYIRLQYEEINGVLQITNFTCTH